MISGLKMDENEMRTRIPNTTDMGVVMKAIIAKEEAASLIPFMTSEEEKQ